jgi:hypothetical protein
MPASRRDDRANPSANPDIADAPTATFDDPTPAKLYDIMERMGRARLFPRTTQARESRTPSL